MLHEVLLIIAEGISNFSPVSRAPLVSPRQQILFEGKFVRVLISIVLLWMIGAGIIILLKAYPYLSVISAVALVLLTNVSIFTFYALWWHSELVEKVLIYVSLFALLASTVVFFSLLPANADFSQPDLFWSFFMLIPSSMIFLFVSVAGRKTIFLANRAYLFSDEIDDNQFRISNAKTHDEEPAIEMVDW